MEFEKKSEEYWKKKLDKKQFHILREKGTEIPGTGKLLKNKKKGTYVCAGCGNKLEARAMMKELRDMIRSVRSNLNDE